MNYLRGALSAASQYYKDLPPINPSTLTGAIDVIVVERPTENGGIELVCSPFHVRFGKWQVLRPGEKKVKVLVNGHSIPFDMKIGDAGEAFFVFETDGDVPDELITSPLLQPTDVGQTEGSELSTGRFGAADGEPEVEGLRAGSDKPDLSTAEYVQRQEPEFLDLNASRLDSKTQPTTIRSTTNPLHDNNVGISASLPATRPPSAESSTPYSIMSDEDIKSGSSRQTAIENDPAESSHRQTNGLGNHIQAGMKHEADTGDDLLPRVDVQDAQPPKVMYHHDVVLDVSGYHSKRASERTIESDEWSGRELDARTTAAQSAISLNLDITPNGSRSPSPESLSSTSAPRALRATSEPPEYGTPLPPPPEYSWEWGAFPQRSPIRATYSNEDSDLPRNVGFHPQLPDTVPRNQAHARPRSRSPIPEAEGGRLEADAVDPYKVWLDFEGQRLDFEISLCGDAIRTERAVVGAQQFEAQRVTYQQLMSEAGIVHGRDLVVRWDDEYICRSDDSPLMPALVNWRRRTLLPASPGQNAKAGLYKPVVAPRPSTWSRWWSRNRTLPDAKEISLDKPVTPPEIGKAHVKRPSLDHSESAPIDRTALGLQQPTPVSSSVPFPSAAPEIVDTKYAKTLRLTSDQLKALGLHKGANGITFSLSASGQIACSARIFLWDATDHIVVSDIDGTITKSDALGHVFTMIGRDWTHLGVAKLYTDICRNGYKIMYLTSRAIGQADSTRDYLKGIKQNNYQLPEGPVIMSPDRLLTSLHREVIMRKPETFKMACLRDIQRLFGTSSHNPFYAGFGNRITDALSYRSVNVPSARIFTIDSSGEVKMELLELAGYKSSYIHMTDIVDQMFPPINRKWAPEYTDFNYWRAPIAEYELPDDLTAPPSPSLSASARSDTSTQTTLSRLRHFSLGRPSSSRGPSPESSLSSSPGRTSLGNVYQGGHIRTAASLDRLGSFLPVGDSVEYVTAGKDRDDRRRDAHVIPDGFFGVGVRHSRSRSRPESMPGSLDLSVRMQDPRWFKHREMEDGEVDDEDDDDEEYGDDEDGEEGDAEEAAEDAFDDDLLATGEMENVPFL